MNSDIVGKAMNEISPIPMTPKSKPASKKRNKVTSADFKKDASLKKKKIIEDAKSSNPKKNLLHHALLQNLLHSLALLPIHRPCSKQERN